MHTQTPYVHAQTHTHTQTEEIGDPYGLSQWNEPYLTPICLNMSHFKQCLLRSPAEDLCTECVKGQEKSTSEASQTLILISCLFQQQLPCLSIEETCLFSPRPQHCCRGRHQYKNFNSISRVFPLCSSPTTDNQCKSNPGFYLKLSWL